MKILSIIPARAGSKGLPNKNILKLIDKPLIAWTIEASLNSTYITHTIVSSDSNEILDISHKYGSEVMKRPTQFATDDASSESVVKHVLKTTKETFDYIILLQPTSPLRDSNDIDQAFNKLFNSNATAAISVCNVDNKILKAFVKDYHGYIHGISNNTYPFIRRQDLPQTLMSNGAIYIVKVEEFLKNNSFYTTKTISYIMDETKSLDIDTKEDFERITKILQ